MYIIIMDIDRLDLWCQYTQVFILGGGRRGSFPPKVLNFPPKQLELPICMLYLMVIECKCGLWNPSFRVAPSLIDLFGAGRCREKCSFLHAEKEGLGTRSFPLKEKILDETLIQVSLTRLSCKRSLYRCCGFELDPSIIHELVRH